jgi:hypothetical protein
MLVRRYEMKTKHCSFTLLLFFLLLVLLSTVGCDTELKKDVVALKDSVNSQNRRLKSIDSSMRALRLDYYLSKGEETPTIDLTSADLQDIGKGFFVCNLSMNNTLQE